MMVAIFAPAAVVGIIAIVFAAASHCFATALLMRFLETLKPTIRADLVSEVVEKVMDCIEAWR